MDTPVDFFTQKELKKLFNAITKKTDYPYWRRDLCMFQIGYLCGLRASEIGKLKFEYFNEKQGEIFCPRLKNSVSNTIRLDDQRKKLLKQYLQQESGREWRGHQGITKLSWSQAD